MKLSQGLAKGQYTKLLDALVNANRENGRVVCEDVEKFLLDQAKKGYYLLDTAETTKKRLSGYHIYGIHKEFINDCIRFVDAVEETGARKIEYYDALHDRAKKLKKEGLEELIVIWCMADIESYMEGVMNGILY